jgi:5-(carboxyamino)imidazole ribonucleotide mutase
MKVDVAIIMGSKTDWNCMQAAAEVLDELGITYKAEIVSAHRTPDHMRTFAQSARSRGVKVIIAGAGGAAHLPGMTAAWTTLPVIGVPVPVGHLNGEDALLSIVQMPKGVPVACVAIGNAANAALLAAQILSVTQPELAEKIQQRREQSQTEVLKAKLE